MIVACEAATYIGVDIRGATVVIQGFGNVGSVSAKLLAEAGAKIIGITDWMGGVYNLKGLDISKLIEHVAKNRTVVARSARCVGWLSTREWSTRSIGTWRC